jgi:hypothetical protein
MRTWFSVVSSNGKPTAGNSDQLKIDCKKV